MGDAVERCLNTVWQPCTQMADAEEFPPVEIIGASGSRFLLPGNREIIDGISSWWCKSLGHRHPALTEALIKQAEQFEHVIPAGTATEVLALLSERLVNMAGGSGPEGWGEKFSGGRTQSRFGKVFYAGDGCSAVEIAMKLAWQAQRQAGRKDRTRFAALAGAYHGDSAGAMSVGDLGVFRDVFSGMLREPVVLEPLPYRSGPDDPKWDDASEEWPEIEKKLDAAADSLVAVVYEAVLQGAGGMRIFSPDLLRRLRGWADANEVYLIADEIASGMGRCGKLLAGHHAGMDIQPDFVTVSKALTGGCLAMSAVITTDEIYELFLGNVLENKAFMHSNTFSGNALGAALGNAVFETYDREGILEQVAEKSIVMSKRIRELAGESPWAFNPRSIGMVAALDIRGRDGVSFPPEARAGFHIHRDALERGAWLRPLGDTMYILPPLNISMEDLAALFDILAVSVQIVCEKLDG